MKGFDKAFFSHKEIIDGVEKKVNGTKLISNIKWGGPLKFLAAAGIIAGMAADIFWQNEAA